MDRDLQVGAAAPWFHAQALSGNPRYAFDTVAGRWTLLLFVGHAADEEAARALKLVTDNRDIFDDEKACFFGVTIDPDDAKQGRIAQSLPGLRWFLDYDRSVSALYGAVSEGQQTYGRRWLLLDPMLRVFAQCPMDKGADLIAQLRTLAKSPFSLPAPVLVVPGVLPLDLCRHLISLYERHGGTESGFMRDIAGVTTLLTDPSHKRRCDYTITDGPLIEALNARLGNVLRPLLRRAFQFDPTRVERFIVARYDAEGGGFFRPHRDNTTKGTAHRKFAVTINLDTAVYEGGDLRFPEFGSQTYRAPTGGAVVFSCSLLHEATPVTKGKRYAFLPFLYDDSGARLREQNLGFVSPELRDYRSGLTDL